MTNLLEGALALLDVFNTAVMAIVLCSVVLASVLLAWALMGAEQSGDRAETADSARRPRAKRL